MDDFNPELADGFEPEDEGESVSTDDLVAAAELSDPNMDTQTLQ